ncbi:hypothetical protein ABIA06_001043 [Bradyrhizobium yuanmingense]|uniref:hypothetical protein n=1 Tax=Bradyrhizobium yuanmingense TaxID=108015 RepID=UPI0035121FE5
MAVHLRKNRHRQGTNEAQEDPRAVAKEKPITRAGITRRRNAAKRRRLRFRTPLGRLDADGASSAQNNNRCLLWLAIEWGLERAPKVGPAPSAELCDYCRKHGINVDWILDGDLRGLKRMIDERRGHQRDERALLARYAQLTPEHQLIVTAEINRILAERD